MASVRTKQYTLGITSDYIGRIPTCTKEKLYLCPGKSLCCPTELNQLHCSKSKWEQLQILLLFFQVPLVTLRKTLATLIQVVPMELGATVPPLPTHTHILHYISKEFMLLNLQNSEKTRSPEKSNEFNEEPLLPAIPVKGVSAITIGNLSFCFCFFIYYKFQNSVLFQDSLIGVIVLFFG